MTANKKIELLAPAGSFECLTAAVQNGADAVYFAGKHFGARSFAANFDNEEIKRAVDYCGLRGVKTHITVNTAYYDGELDSVLKFVDFVYSAGADAVIVSDLGLARLIKKYFPDLSVHASTQMTIHNLSGVIEAKKMGAERVVLSRELSFEDIKYISQNTDTELEIFAHGALCMCYSGQCLLSSVIGGRSGNRGECAQPCRMPFGSEKKHILSLKDLCLVRHLKKIKDIGVSSLKIEGRMKGAAYVAAVVSTYRKYLDGVEELSHKDFELLEKVFNRGGLTDGYFTGKTGEKMFAFKKPDNPYLKQDNEIKEKFEKNYININNIKKDAEAVFCAKTGEHPKLCLKCEDYSAEYVFKETAQKAKSKPLDGETVRLQLEKTGDIPFRLNKCTVDLDGEVFLSRAQLNEIRREAFGLLQNKIVSSKTKKSSFEGLESRSFKNVVSQGFSAYVSSAEQLKEVLKFDFVRIYLPFELLKCIKDIPKDKIDLIYLSLPYITKDSQKAEVKKYIDFAKKLGIKGLLVHNISQTEYKADFDLAADAGFNALNGETVSALAQLGAKSVILSREISLKQAKRLKKSVECELTVYGKIPVMVCENCIIKNYEGCKCEGKFRYIKDRMGISFPVKRDYPFCTSVLYNSVPILCPEKDTEAECIKNLFFTTESQRECKKICAAYMQKQKYPDEKNYTGGYLFK